MNSTIAQSVAEPFQSRRLQLHTEQLNLVSRRNMISALERRGATNSKLDNASNINDQSTGNISASYKAQPKSTLKNNFLEKQQQINNEVVHQTKKSSKVPVTSNFRFIEQPVTNSGEKDSKLR